MGGGEVAQKPSPDVLALIICESVVEDARTHNKCILNAYNIINAFKFPCKQDRFTIFVALTNGHNKHHITTRITTQGQDKPLLKIEGEIDFKDPLQTVDMVFDMRGLPLPAPGIYVVEVVGDDGRILKTRKVMANQVQPKQGGQA
jgi:hypothetical protein